MASLKACGAWGSFDGFYVMAAHHPQAALVNWAAPEGPGLTPVNSPAFHADSGYEGDGATSYLDTGLRQGEGRYLPQDHHAGLWAASTSGSGTAWGNSRNRMVPLSGGALSTRSNANSAASTPVAGGSGHSAFSRSAADRYRVFKDGGLAGEPEVAASTALVQPFILLGYGTAAEPVSLSRWRLAGAHFGQALSDPAMAGTAAALARYLEGLSTWR
jgi:hypothetical protein